MVIEERGSPQGGDVGLEGPDTLDLTEHARLAIHGITGSVDPEIGDMWFHMELDHKRPFMKHISCDNACTPKYGESLALLGHMTGEGPSEIEQLVRKRLISQIEQGIYWNKAEDFRPWRCMYNWDREDTNPKDEDLASPVGNARMMRTLITWREIESDPGYDELIEAMVAGQARMLVEKEDYAYFPDAGYGEAYSYPRNTGWYHQREARDELEGMEGSVNCYHGHTIYAMSIWHRLSGDERALELARKVCNYAMKPRFWGGVALTSEEAERVATTALSTKAPNAPRYGPSPAGMPASHKGHWFSHFHRRAVGLRGMLEYGVTVGDQSVIEFVHNAYQYSKSWMFDRLGWIDGAPAKGEACEGCNLADLAALQIRLTDAGVGEYWDDLDHLVRNALIEQQYTDLDRAHRIVASLPEDTETPRWAQDALPNQICYEDVLERLVGTIFAMSYPHGAKLSTIGCCTGNGAQAFYYAWEAAVRERPGLTQINLLLNRAAKTVDVASWLPYEGKVAVTIKAADRIALRMPSWVPRSQIRLQVNDGDRPLIWLGSYLLVDDLKPGDTMQVTFPVVESTARHLWAARIPHQETEFTARFRGSTCVGISPCMTLPGWMPFYEREHMLAEQAPTKRARAVVPGRTFVDW